MQIVGDDLRFDAEQPFVQLNGSLKVLQRLQVLHVAYVLADESVLVPGDAKGVLELCPTGQDLPDRERQFHRKGSVAPCAANRLGRGYGTRNTKHGTRVACCVLRVA
jgi:hypothetical protein